ncbi:MAG: hypothetical protein KatS3mg054_1412 [Chloroflexus sp.]|nr:MAG: hypothetical protein KatS3mg054_1412 [Chloroflexus sp.]
MPCPYDSCHTSASVRQCIVQVQYQGNRWLVCRGFYASGCDQDTTSTGPPWWGMHNRSARATLACASGTASRRLALPVDYQHPAYLVGHAQPQCQGNVSLRVRYGEPEARAPSGLPAPGLPGGSCTTAVPG